MRGCGYVCEVGGHLCRVAVGECEVSRGAFFLLQAKVEDSRFLNPSPKLLSLRLLPGAAPIRPSSSGLLAWRRGGQLAI